MTEQPPCGNTSPEPGGRGERKVFSQRYSIWQMAMKIHRRAGSPLISNDSAKTVSSSEVSILRILPEWSTAATKG